MPISDLSVDHRKTNEMSNNKFVSDSYKVMHDMSSDNNNIIVAGGRLPPMTSTALSSHVEDMVSSGLASSDEERESSAEVVTRREMILALIARSEVEEEEVGDPETEETNNNNDEGNHQHKDSSTASEVQGVNAEAIEDRSVDHKAAKRTKWSWGSYLKFVTPLDDLPLDQAKARCDLCNKTYSRRSIRSHINIVHRYGNPRVKCDVCDTEVKRSSLRKHKLRYHPSSERVNCKHPNGEESQSGVYLKFATPIDDAIKNSAKIKCNLCERIIVRTYISHHIKNFHNLSPRVKCDECGKEVKEYSLRRHKLRIHKK